MNTKSVSLESAKEGTLTSPVSLSLRELSDSESQQVTGMGKGKDDKKKDDKKDDKKKDDKKDDRKKDDKGKKK